MIRTSAPEPASSRATVSPAKLAPQIRTSRLPSSGVRSSPRFVARTGIASILPLFAAVSPTDTLIAPAPTGTPVEGSGGLLLEIDGKVVPNYAATMVAFEEGDV